MQTPSQTVQTADLGQGWFATSYQDGSATIRNPDKGQRIDLNSAEVQRLREMLNHLTV